MDTIHHGLGGGSPLLPVARTAAGADRIHRRFFLAGIAAMLTVGVGWGAWLLLQVAANESFTAPSVLAINAHGQAQIYGWVGLFILGFAYQAFPRFKRTRLALPRLAAASFLLMLAGIVARSLAEPRGGTPPWAEIAMAGGALQLLAVLAFATVVATTYRRADASLEVNDRYILAAVGWFVAAAAFDLFHLHGTLYAPTREALLAQVATYQFALRDLQIHGLAMTMIFGVSMRFFPASLSTPPPSAALARRLWLPLNLAIAGEVVGFVMFMRTKAAPWAALMGIAIVALAACATAFVLNLRLFRPMPDADRSLKFLRASHVWLVLSLAMLVAAPAYFRLAGVPFSHAWYGAMRHAITVGFISLSIMGVAARVVPTLAGIHTGSLTTLWVPFVLVNLGCATRVAGQIATDVTPAAFPFAGVSGLLELSGLAIWGAGLARVLLRAPRPAALPAPAPPARAAAPPLGLEHTVVEWVRRHPQTLPVFAALGMDSCCGGAETVANAAAHNGVDLAILETELRRHVR